LIRVSISASVFSSFGLEIMTQILDGAVRRDLVARWCTLAEQRLQHLTDLFESGRWRRYYGERAFLENVKEAKKAVETWRALASGQPVARTDDARIWPRREREPEHKFERTKFEPTKSEPTKSEPVPLWRASAPATEIPSGDTDLAAEEAPRQLDVDLAALEQALIAPPPVADLATMEQRYPLLRNSLL
jgi:uncharacterized repeat protein (TIGR03809 family)